MITKDRKIEQLFNLITLKIREQQVPIEVLKDLLCYSSSSGESTDMKKLIDSEATLENLINYLKLNEDVDFCNTYKFWKTLLKKELAELEWLRCISENDDSIEQVIFSSSDFDGWGTPIHHNNKGE